MSTGPIEELAAKVREVLSAIEEKGGVRHVRDAAFWGAPAGTPLPLAGRGGVDRVTLPPKPRVRKRVAPKPKRKPVAERAKPDQVDGYLPSGVERAYDWMLEPDNYATFIEKHDQGGGCEDIAEAVESRWGVRQVYGTWIAPDGTREYHSWNESGDVILDAAQYVFWNGDGDGPHVYPADAPQYEKEGDGVKSAVRHVRDAAYWGAPVGTPLPLPPADDRPVLSTAYRGIMLNPYNDYGPDGPTDEEVLSALMVNRRDNFYGAYWTSDRTIAEPFASGDSQTSAVWWLDQPDRTVYGVVLEAQLARPEEPVAGDYAPFVFDSEKGVREPSPWDVVKLVAHLYRRTENAEHSFNGEREYLRDINLYIPSAEEVWPVKALQELIEVKVVRHVRDAAYWGRPVGTPIEPSVVSESVSAMRWHGGEIDKAVAPPARLKPISIVWEGDPAEGRSDIRFGYGEFPEPDEIKPLDDIPIPFGPVPENITEHSITWHPNSEFMFTNMILTDAFGSVGTEYDEKQERALVKQHVEERISQRIWSASLTDPALKRWIESGTMSPDEFWDWRGDFKPMFAQTILDTLHAQVTADRSLADRGLVTGQTAERAREDWDGILRAMLIEPDLNKDDSEENYRKIMRLHRIALLLYTPDIGAEPDLKKGVTHWGDYENVSDEELFLRVRVKELVDAWAGTSSDGSVLSLAVQQTIQSVFGTKDTANFLTDANAPNPDGVKQYVRDNKVWLDAFVHATYDETQDFLDANGIKEAWLYRGMSFNLRDIPDWALDGMTGQQVRDDLDAAIEKEHKEFIRKTKTELVKNPQRMRGPLVRMKLRELTGKTGDDELSKMDFTDEQYAEADKWASEKIKTDPKGTAAELANLFWPTRRYQFADQMEREYALWLMEEHTAKLVKATMNPVSSFSASSKTAANFGNHSFYKSMNHPLFGIVLKCAVPAERIWSTAISGNGCLTEQEVTVLGGGEDDQFGTVDDMVLLT